MDPDIPAIQQSLAARLSSYKRPRLILAMAADDLPKLSSAKVDKRALRALLIRQQNP
jgi:acyl-CoA synthetase (AMP-forming)/AMP-acid ligase II